ncbi:hypothetical protein BDW22DRAFT_1348952 [Trametopsis cervina]|nr:hypothetical protein BDW22DRAFT_1348952 [Trametopsis cervina]
MLFKGKRGKPPGVPPSELETVLTNVGHHGRSTESVDQGRGDPHGEGAGARGEGEDDGDEEVTDRSHQGGSDTSEKGARSDGSQDGDGEGDDEVDGESGDEDSAYKVEVIRAVKVDPGRKEWANANPLVCVQACSQ